MVPLHVFAKPKPEWKPPVRPPRFALFDPLRRFNRKRYIKRSSVPRILSFEDGARPPAPLPTPRTPDALLPAPQLMRRVAALAFALHDLPKQARRFARWQARCDLNLTRRKHPLRPGRPPGSPPRRMPEKRKRQEHIVLAETHSLAWQALQRRDSS